MSSERERMPRTDSTQAMKSIFSAYGEDEGPASSPPLPRDSLGLDDNISGSEDEGSSTRSGTPKLSTEKRIFESYQNAPLQFDHMFSKKPRMERKATRLVSYGPEEEEDEEYHGEEADHDVSYEEMTDETHMDYAADQHLTEDDLLPPEPMGKCSKHLQEKISRLYQKALEGQDLKANIQNKKHFRNPSLYEKLIEFCEIDEKGTNYPPELYNPGIWSTNSHYDELARVQKIEMDKREKEKKDKTKIEFVTGTKKVSDGVTVVEQKRKSKWDAQPGSGSGSRPGSSGPAVTTNPSGQKTTVISAMGTIKKHK